MLQSVQGEQLANLHAFRPNVEVQTSFMSALFFCLNVDGDRTDLDECSGAANVSFVDATPCRQLFISSAVRGC
ncbi:hypothetical protein RB195_000859 [Necator americanus]|uniref:Uncharacterized protein n=1 Tax=Necator americanus TaxID=51031 RepID=A0ABR1DBN5_NECAM